MGQSSFWSIIWAMFKQAWEYLLWLLGFVTVIATVGFLLYFAFQVYMAGDDSDQVYNRFGEKISVLVSKFGDWNTDFSLILTSDSKDSTSSQSGIYWDKKTEIKIFLEKSGRKKLTGNQKAMFDYIDKYKWIAIAEYHRSKEVFGAGVPPSVTITQGCLESGAGRSYLFKKTRNHFCIKCRRVVKNGKYVIINGHYQYKYRKPACGCSEEFNDDHPYDKFEIHNSDSSSYASHSNLLMVPRYSHMLRNIPFLGMVDSTPESRYFKGVYAVENKTVPYVVAWFWGLKQSGYATKKTYHSDLTAVLYSYNIWKIDFMVSKL